MRVKELLFRLARDLEMYGPVRGDWPNYSRLGNDRHHCHLKKGHPTYVAVWTEHRGTVLVEIVMREHTRKHPTDELVAVTLHVRRSKVSQLKRYAESLEQNEGKNSSIAEVFPEYIGCEQQVSLRAYRTREGLTQKQLAELTGIAQHQISEMENGKRSIGKDRARRLAEVLHCDYRQLL